jgi:hypothetical protein
MESYATKRGHKKAQQRRRREKSEETGLSIYPQQTEKRGAYSVAAMSVFP